MHSAVRSICKTLSFSSYSLTWRFCILGFVYCTVRSLCWLTSGLILLFVTCFLIALSICICCFCICTDCRYACCCFYCLKRWQQGLLLPQRAFFGISLRHIHFVGRLHRYALHLCPDATGWDLLGRAFCFAIIYICFFSLITSINLILRQWNDWDSGLNVKLAGSVSMIAGVFDIIIIIIIISSGSIIIKE